MFLVHALADTDNRAEFFRRRVILTLKNENGLTLNNTILSRFRDIEIVLLSIDTALNKETSNPYNEITLDFLYSL